MEQQQWTCPECSKVIAADDTVLFVRERITHFYCRRPRTLGPEERVLLFLLCWEHVVAKCDLCDKGYRQSELANDLFSGEETCVRNVVRTCLTAFAYISTPARCFLLKSSERLRWQDRQHKSW
jgi:hypothetical protein